MNKAPFITIFPSAGLIVRDPVDPGMAPIPETGKTVRDSTYWQRRIASGDVTLTPPQVPDEEHADGPQPDDSPRGRKRVKRAEEE